MIMNGLAVERRFTDDGSLPPHAHSTLNHNSLREITSLTTPLLKDIDLTAHQTPSPIEYLYHPRPLAGIELIDDFFQLRRRGRVKRMGTTQDIRSPRQEKNSHNKPLW